MVEHGDDYQELVDLLFQRAEQAVEILALAGIQGALLVLDVEDLKVPGV